MGATKVLVATVGMVGRRNSDMWRAMEEHHYGALCCIGMVGGGKRGIQA